jgi:hypothetical protein
MTGDEDEIILVSSIQWITMRGEGGYHETNSRNAIWMLQNLDRHRSMEVRSFAAQLGRFDLYRMDDQEVVKLIRDAIRDGRVIAVQKGAKSSASPSATVQLHRLVAQVEKHTRGKLSYRGRQYQMVVDVDLRNIPDRDYYEVASQSEARAVLDSTAKDTGAAADLLKQAGDKLSKDWRPPFSHPEGLVLLRRIPAPASEPKDTGPALTPSQIRALMKKDQDDFVLELEHLYHDDRPVHQASFTVELSDGSKVEGQLDAEGRATVHLSVMPTRVQFGPDSRAWKQVDETKNPDYQEELSDIDSFINARLDTST